MGLINQKINNIFYRFLLRITRKSSIFLVSLLRIITLNKIPPIPVVSVLIRKKEKILGIIRNDGQGIGLPAGLIHWNETPEKAAIRETLEETGLEVKLKKMFGIYCEPSNKIDNLNVINIVYLGTIKQGRLKGSFEGEPKWFSFQDLLQAKNKNNVKKILRDFLKTQRKETNERKRY